MVDKARARELVEKIRRLLHEIYDLAPELFYEIQHAVSGLRTYRIFITDVKSYIPEAKKYEELLTKWISFLNIASTKATEVRAYTETAYWSILDFLNSIEKSCLR